MTSLPSPPAPADPALPNGYTLHLGYPPIQDYLHLRAASGLTPKTRAQAAPIAHNSWHGCYITFTPPAADSREDGASATTTTPTIVAMGRIIGDGGWYFHIADMAVLPAHQRKGLGDAVLKHLMGHIRANAPSGYEDADEDEEKEANNVDGKNTTAAGKVKPKGAYVTLFADGPGRKLYARNGFVDTMPSGQLGMMMPMGWEGR